MVLTSKVIQAVTMTLVTLSLIISFATLIYSIKKKLQKLFLSELILIVLCSEIFYGLSRYLSLVREGNGELIELHIVPNMLQITCSLFCDCCTLLGTLFITLKIFDGIVNSSKIFSHKCMEIVTRLITLVSPLILSVVFSLLQMFLFSEERTLLCNPVSCLLSSGLNIYPTIFVLALTLATFIVIIVPLCYLRSKSKMIKQKYPERHPTMTQFKKIQCRMLIFPIISLIFWAWRFSYQICLIILEKNNSDVPLFLAWLYYVTNSLRGTIYSMMAIISHDKLRNKFISLCLCRKYKSEEELNDSPNDISLILPQDASFDEKNNNSLMNYA